MNRYAENRQNYQPQNGVKKDLHWQGNMPDIFNLILTAVMRNKRQAVQKKTVTADIFFRYSRMNGRRSSYEIERQSACILIDLQDPPLVVP